SNRPDGRTLLLQPRPGMEADRRGSANRSQTGPPPRCWVEVGRVPSERWPPARIPHSRKWVHLAVSLPGSRISGCLQSLPLCGFPLREPSPAEELAHSYDICGCCGCEFGLCDHAHYRDWWLTNGTPWFHPELKPENWDLKEQLKHSD